MKYLRNLQSNHLIKSRLKRVQKKLKKLLSMKIYNLLEIVSYAKEGYLFLDTTALVAMVNYEEYFSDLLSKLRDVDCPILTIPSVVFEFTRTDSDKFDCFDVSN